METQFGKGSIFVAQIPQKIVVYRTAQLKQDSSDKLNLGKRDLPHIPLFEGEDHLKYLSLENNNITTIDPLISLTNLIYLNLYNNCIKNIENLEYVPKLKVLLLILNFLPVIF